ncbi:MAG: glycosyltransferase [Azoarcus sp.]|nr:glycosyltransferase [Azoarcus sp.]
MCAPVVHLIHSSGFYGAERMLLEHCLRTPAAKHRVVFLDTPYNLTTHFRRVGIDCVGVEGLAALFKELRQRPGIVNAHNFRAQIDGWLCAVRLGLPLVLTQHGFTLRSAKQRLYAWIAVRLGRSRHVGKVVCVSRSIARLHEIAGVAADKIEVIPNGLPSGATTLPRVPEAAPLIGFAGRLSVEKGPDLFLDAAIPLLYARPDLRAAMIGDGPAAETLRERVAAAGLSERVLFPGYQSDMEPWFARLSALVLSSRTEGTPMTVLEAMRAGVPVAAFAVGGVPDMIEDGVSGLLAPAGNVAALAACIGRLLDASSLAERLAAAARERQRREHDLDALAPRWHNVYATLAGQTPC